VLPCPYSYCCSFVDCILFFQAEDGIRDFHVTGVQTCALPISARRLWVSAVLGIAILDALYRQAAGVGPGFFLTWFLPYLGYFLAGRMIYEGELRVPQPALMLALSVFATAWGVYTLSESGQLKIGRAHV